MPKYLAAMTEKDSTYLQLQVGAERRGRGAAPVRAPEIVETHSEYRSSLRRRPRGGDRDRGARRAGRARCTCWSRSSRIVVRISVRAKDDVPHADGRASCCAISWAWIFRAPTRRAKDTSCRRCRRATSYTVDFHLDLPELYPASFSFSPAIADGTLHGLHRCATGSITRMALQMGRGEGADLRLHAPALPRGGERAAAAAAGRRLLEKQLG